MSITNKQMQRVFAVVGLSALLVLVYVYVFSPERGFEEDGSGKGEREKIDGKTIIMEQNGERKMDHNLSSKNENVSKVLGETKWKKTKMKKPKILYYTKFFHAEPPLAQIRGYCSLFAERCEVTGNRSELPTADAVIFHAPDFVDVAAEVKAHLSMFRDKLNVFLSQETYTNLQRFYKIHLVPENFFHWTMTFLRGSDVPMPYGGTFLDPNVTRERGFPPLSLPFDRETILKGKEVEGVVWFVSNCVTLSRREDAVRALAKHIRVDIFGQCATTERGKRACPFDPARPNCAREKSRYYFLLIPENDMCVDYVTEKFWYNYALPVVLIVQKRAIYERHVPRGSFIAMDDFRGPKELADYLRLLIANPDQYLQYFRWRSEGWSVVWNNADGLLTGYCRLCEKLLEEQQQENPFQKPSDSPRRPRPIADVLGWYKKALNCADGAKFVAEWISAAAVAGGN